MNNKALDALRKGKIIAVFDSDKREGETDLIFHAKFATPEKIEKLRKEAGGLICIAVSNEIAGEIGLEFFADIFSRGDTRLTNMRCSKTAYGDKPAFSIPINHKQVYTGITDHDRALTIRKFAELVEESTDKRCDFLNEFYTPGHVFILVGRGIENRKGHTELSVALAENAGLSGVMVLCEMLGSGTALGKEDAKKYCKKNKIEFIEGKDIHD